MAPLIDKHNQTVGDINNSKVLVVNGDVVLNEKGGEVYDMTLELLKDEISRLTQRAAEDFRSQLKVFIQDFINRLQKIENLALLETLSDFRIQDDFRTVASGYASSDSTPARELILNVLIDRMKEKNGTTSQKLISEALKVVAGMPFSSACLLGILTLRTETFHGFPFIVDSFFSQLGELVNHIASIGKEDIEYLKIKNCLTHIGGVYPVASLEQTLLNRYDLFFRHKLSQQQMDSLEVAIPNLNNIVYGNSSMFLAMAVSEPYEYCLIETNSRLFAETMHKNGTDDMIPVMHRVMEFMPLYSEPELRMYFEQKNENWNKVFDLLSSSGPLATLQSTAVGNYIGSLVMSHFSSYHRSLSMGSILNPKSI